MAPDITEAQMQEFRRDMQAYPELVLVSFLLMSNDDDGSMRFEAFRKALQLRRKQGWTREQLQAYIPHCLRILFHTREITDEEKEMTEELLDSLMAQQTQRPITGFVFVKGDHTL